MPYDFKSIEKKWQKLWEKSKIFHAKEGGKKKKYYVLEMYPYPSGSGLHMGHAFNYAIGDIFARFKRLQGFNVLHPSGFDSFGLPAENAAIKFKTHPKKFTDDAIKNFIMQEKALGLSYDWSRLLWSHDPLYYGWNQWIFLKMLERGLIYRKKAPVNYCPKCDTVLANEQVHGGKCWRHEDTDVEIRRLEQWFLKITDYADEIYENTKKLDWPERIKVMQENWIGKSEGAEIAFEIKDRKYMIFTTRADTLFGVTFLVMSAQHPDVMEIVSEKQRKEVEKFLKKIRSTKEKDIEKMDKEGVFTGSYATHPLTGEKIPVWVGNFVLAEYGSGVVMAVPAHDQRDFEFAQKYKLPVKMVIKPQAKDIKSIAVDSAYTDFGKLVDSGDFNGLASDEAKVHIVRALEAKKLGKFTTQFKLRDWLVSRQRYWGTPIPVVYCDKCGIVPVKEKELPVKLPEKVRFGRGNPLETSREFVEAKCPKCSGKARRETDTMDVFFDSSWYFLRFCDSKNKKELFSRKKAMNWMPVDFYTGGAEHACMHLIYARFFTKALRDMKLLDFDEPFAKLFNQGMVHAKDGFVMSKSRGNVVNPSDVIEKFGSDSLRMFLVSNASPDRDFNWDDKGIEGSFRLLKKISEFFEKVKFSKSSARLESGINKTIMLVEKDIENLNYNLAVIGIRKLFDLISDEKGISRKDAENFAKILSPFCPYITEELWSRMGNKTFISLEKWPEADEKKINPEFEKEEKIIDGLVGDINNIFNIIRNMGKNASRVYLYSLPKEVDIYGKNIKSIEKRTGLKAAVYAVNDPKKHDPENKSRKVKPGKPGIYLE
jgi:leucyl-tRNA synthetase